LDRPFSEVREGRNVWKSEIDDSYYEHVHYRYFDEIFYDVSWGKIEGISLMGSPLSLKDIDSLMDIYKAVYGNSSRGLITRYGTTGYDVSRVWRVNEGIYACIF